MTPVVGAWAREPITRSGPPRFTIGLAAYSFKKYFRYMKGKTQTPLSDGETMDMVRFLDYCVAHGFDAAELTSYFFKPDADAAYFLNLRQQAYLRGVAISGTAIGNDFTVGQGPKLEKQVADALKWIDHADTLGAPHIRFFAGTGAQLAAHPERLGEAVDAVLRCAEKASKKGIFIGIENHGNLTSEQMLKMMDRVNNPWVGINLDTGNFVGDDPYGDLEKCAPFAVNVQVKMQMKRADKSKYPADVERVGKILQASNYQGTVVLEFEEEKPYDHIPAAVDRLRKALGIG